ncbi:MAG: gephyrin-like molybdotransferase Glp [Sphingomonadales bacterium]
MAQISDDCFASGDELMPLDQALKLIGERLSPVVARETVDLDKALGRVLAEDVVASVNVPPHDNAAVDGYAFRFADLTRGGGGVLPIVGRAAAGHPIRDDVAAGGAVRIFTGAPMPGGCDTVLMQEDARLEDGTVIVPPGLRAGANRRKAGEDIARGQIVLKTGRRLQPADLGVAASIGQCRLPVFKRLKVALFSTGDELREPGETLAPGSIHDSNRYVLKGMLGRLGAEVVDLGILPDRYDEIRGAIARASASHDLIVTSGGVSVGEEDHVRLAVEALGHLHFWRLAVKPGRPIALGQIGAALFAGLPGNPVAVVLTFARIVRPLVEILSGAAARPAQFFQVRAGFACRKKKGRREWIRVRLETVDDGVRVVRRYPRQGSGILMSVVDSDGVIELPEDLTELEEGAMVNFLPFDGIGA